MDKPIIFLSHSSKDSPILKRLKKILDDKLQGFVTTFLSSDGQSIPFGTNWSSKVEEALKMCSLVFVFISPNSIYSKWVYFESGMTYGKNKKVVPVGILGTDISEATGPLYSLQGFNIGSIDSLNNLITVINNEYNLSLSMEFNESDYEHIFQMEDTSENSLFRDLSYLIAKVTFYLHDYRDEKSVNTFYREIKAVEDSIKNSKFGINAVKLNDSIQTFGLLVQWIDRVNYIFAILDPDLTTITFPIVQQMVDEIALKENRVFKFDIDFKPSVNVISESYRITSKIFESKISLAEENLFEYDNIVFNIKKIPGRDKRIEMTVKYEGVKLVNIPLYKLIKLLFEKEIIFLDSR
ncbi:MAG: toll/interleukin-1 receptor domain-containing protein [Cyclobacteriaceae bacterium]